jgi:hypothetical protein
MAANSKPGHALSLPLSKEHLPTLNSTFMTPTAPQQISLPQSDPTLLTTDDVMNELRPVPQMQRWIKHTQRISFFLL